jgi:hypothetical protein
MDRSAKEHKNLFAMLEKLKDESKPHSTSEILGILSSSEFNDIKKQWFAPTPSVVMPASQESYVREITEYTLNAIRLYETAIPHKTISSIELFINQDAACEEIQPQIDIQFDTGLYHIDIGMFWDDEIGLEREGKKNCQTMAETVWFEFKGTPYMELSSLCNSIKQAVGEQYPASNVICTTI